MRGGLRRLPDFRAYESDVAGHELGPNSMVNWYRVREQGRRGRRSAHAHRPGTAAGRAYRRRSVRSEAERGRLGRGNIMRSNPMTGGLRGIPFRVRLLGTGQQGRDPSWRRVTRFRVQEQQGRPGSCDPEGSQVVSGEPVGYENLLVRDDATGAYQLVDVPSPGVMPADAHFQAASADLSHVIFTETSQLPGGARYGVGDLYEWDEGALRLVNVLPKGTPLQVRFRVPRPTAPLSSLPRTWAVRTRERYRHGAGRRYAGRRSSGGGIFRAASTNGSQVLFTNESKLTADSTAAAGEPDFFECALPEGASNAN